MINNDKVSEFKRMMEQEGSEPEKNLPPPTLPDLNQELADLRQQLSAQQEDLLRQLAEFQNFQKRLTKEKEDVVRYANESLTKEFFPVLDGLEITLSHVPEEQKSDPLPTGVEMILKQLLQVLKKNGLEEISGTGEIFDPNYHEAIASETRQDMDPGRVVTTHRKGYKLKDRLLRAALVTVSKRDE